MPETPIFRGFFALQAAKPAPEGAAKPSTPLKTLPKVALETSLGRMVIEIDTVAAPVTAANFLRYVDEGAYDGGLFHRTVRRDNQAESPVKIGVIQAMMRQGAKMYPAIPLERTAQTGIPHLHGTISMARSDADTATHQFFVCIGDQPELDYGGRRHPDEQGFASFGRLVEGWLVLEQIQQSPAKGQTLTPAVQIVRARRL
jgi:peptidyl-prolyl cis-trans isomerase A (cyclophilin A)